MKSFLTIQAWPVLVASALALNVSPLPAQEATPGVEVLARGPVHEAYAATAEFPTPGPVVPRIPPDPVEELPPDQRPAGENVTWIPGYWHWDEERTDFIWISGFWRVPPPGRIWVPGSWREVQGGWQWVQGMWQDANVQPVAPGVNPGLVMGNPGAEGMPLNYLPPPPAPLELAPAVPAPAVNCFYVPGTWLWRGRYVWRPGYWVNHRPDWVWVASHYRWTPCGYVFVDGYWDYPLATRGVLFAPVAFAPAVIHRPAFVYRPVYAVPSPALYTSLFIRRGHGCYFFGDYFEARYIQRGFVSWCGIVPQSGFGISVNIGRTVGYDPLWSYYQVAHRGDPLWLQNVNDVYAGRYRGNVPRPPRTLVQQNTVINNTQINNTTINNIQVNNYNRMVAPLSALPQAPGGLALKPVAREELNREQLYSRQLREMALNRQKLENSMTQRGIGPKTLQDQPREVKLPVPQTVLVRSQAPQGVKPQPPAPSPFNPELRNKVPQTIPPAREIPRGTPGLPALKPPVKPTLPGAKPGIPPAQPPAVPALPAIKPDKKPGIPPVQPPTRPSLPSTKPPVQPPTRPSLPSTKPPVTPSLPPAQPPLMPKLPSTKPPVTPGVPPARTPSIPSLPATKPQPRPPVMPSLPPQSRPPVMPTLPKPPTPPSTKPSTPVPQVPKPQPPAGNPTLPKPPVRPSSPGNPPQTRPPVKPTFPKGNPTSPVKPTTPAKPSPAQEKGKSRT